MMKSNICDYSDSYILAVTVTITITTAIMEKDQMKEIKESIQKLCTIQ